jgi:hypothetical protein
MPIQTRGLDLTIGDRRLTADHRMGIHPELANVDVQIWRFAVCGDLAVASRRSSTRQGQPKKYISAQRDMTDLGGFL